MDSQGFSPGYSPFTHLNVVEKMEAHCHPQIAISLTLLLQFPSYFPASVFFSAGIGSAHLRLPVTPPHPPKNN